MFLMSEVPLYSHVAPVSYERGTPVFMSEVPLFLMSEVPLYPHGPERVDVVHVSRQKEPPEGLGEGGGGMVRGIVHYLTIN